jgi:hypothetical protein
MGRKAVRKWICFSKSGAQADELILAACYHAWQTS